MTTTGHTLYVPRVAINKAELVAVEMKIRLEQNLVNIDYVVGWLGFLDCVSQNQNVSKKLHDILDTPIAAAKERAAKNATKK